MQEEIEFIRLVFITPHDGRAVEIALAQHRPLQVAKRIEA